MDKNGDCTSPIGQFPGDSGCTAYCEQRITMSYGQERPFTGAYCSDTDTCSVSTGEQFQFTEQWSINAGINVGKRDLNSNSLVKRDDVSVDVIKASLTLGATYTWSKSYTYTESTGHQQNATPNVCGYWTFVPYMME